jgi:hypothetical protein
LPATRPTTGFSAGWVNRNVAKIAALERTFGVAR